MTGRRRRLASALALLALSIACASQDVPAPIARRVAGDEASFLVDPLLGYPLTSDVALEGKVREAHRALVGNGEISAVEAEAEALAASYPAFHPAVVLLAQVDFLSGRAADAIDRLLPVTGELPEYLAAQLLLGHAAERLGEVTLAYSTFRSIAYFSPAAHRRASVLHERAVEIVALRIDEALTRGHVEEAEMALQQLTLWAPEAEITFEAMRRVAVAREDPEAELAALRRLAPLVPDDRTVAERLASLEVEIGDLRAGLLQLESLVAAYPGDEAIVEAMERAKFRWRLRGLPKPAQEVAIRNQINRADFATLLYWLMPAVRYAAINNPPIATDILDHPRRQEIVAVLNLDLMTVDEALHTFEPHRPAMRATVFAALLLLLERAEIRFSCLSDAGTISASSSTYLVCKKAAECHLIPEAADCLPRAPISGAETLDAVRIALNQLEGG